MVRVEVDGNFYEYEIGTTYRDIAKDFEPYNGLDILLVNSNGKLYELSKEIDSNCKLEFITMASSSGHFAYERSVLFIMLKAIHDVYPHLPMDQVVCLFNIENGVFIKIKDFDTNETFTRSIKERMQDIVASKIPIVKKSVPTDTALKTFDMLDLKDKVELFKYRRSSRANLYYIENFTDYFYSYLVDNTKYCKLFDLIQYEDGMVLTTPLVSNPTEVSEFRPNKKLFNVVYESEQLMQNTGISCVADINKSISNGGFTAPVLVQEAAMEKRIGDIAKAIVLNGDIKIVLIAGPSSSGKTTFSHRLSIQLSSNTVHPIPIATDNYFLDRENTPLDEDGNPDYESLRAMDVDGFQEDMNNLLEGKEVCLPTYNFKLGKREYNGETLKLDDNDILVIEGIHCLDDGFVGHLPKDKIFKIYICPLTQLNIDDHNLFGINDERLIRRIVRDNRMRGVSASETIAMWPSVRRGEDLYINPFRDNADVIFNSSLAYEISVLKPYAEALLFGIDSSDPSYVEANRLLKLMDYFLTIPSDVVNNNSLLTEFIGGNVFNV